MKHIDCNIFKLVFLPELRCSLQVGLHSKNPTFQSLPSFSKQHLDELLSTVTGMWVAAFADAPRMCVKKKMRRRWSTLHYKPQSRSANKEERTSHLTFLADLAWFQYSVVYHTIHTMTPSLYFYRLLFYLPITMACNYVISTNIL
jgi:hypothetical protein